jgi:lipoate-protein ligase A
MALLFTEIKERLKRLDETLLLEVLEINSEEIVDRFEDKIEDRIEELEEELEDETEEQDS